MRIPVLNCKRHNVLTGILLALLLLRAYVPVGFMPASGTPFLLELCPAAAPMSAHPAHHHHADTHGHFENCPFGSVPAAGPLSHVIAFEPPTSIASQPVVALEPSRIGVRPQRAHQPRGPPSLT
ncbi:MAG TPA: hypothetical protein VNR70_17725 [Steroidobacteraceae bacterium]|nr:hypothetical protein [Steroidobacteraceae bacterium]